MTAPRTTPSRATPLARRLAQRQGIALESLSPPNARGGRRETIQANDVLDVLDALEARQEQGAQDENKKGASQKGASQKRLFASPRARARAKEEGIDLALLQGKGSGPQGRIVRYDVEQALTQGLQAEQDSASLPVETPFELRPHTTMREVIAERLTLSKRTIPHFTLTTACRTDALLALRAQLNHHFYEQHRRQGAEQAKPFKVSVNDLLVKALALSLDICSKEEIAVNVAWTDEGMKHFQRVDVAVAVDIPGGLLTPVLRDAARKPFVPLARELHALIARARQGKLQPQDYTGGTISISNLGMFGIQNFQAIINPPQAAILAVGAAEKVLTKNPSNEIIEETRMHATLSADHRAIDGAAAAQLCARFKQVVEQPALLLLDHKNVI